MIGCLSHAPQSGTRPTTQVCDLTRNRTGNLLVCGTTPNQLSYASRDSIFFFMISYIPHFNFLSLTLLYMWGPYSYHTYAIKSDYVLFICLT